MKTIIAAIIAIVLILSLAACEGEELPEENTSKLDSSVSENSKPEPSKPEEPSEPNEESASMTFRLGLAGETTELSAGDTLGEWVLENLEVDMDENTESASIDYIHAEFSGTVTLEGYIERDQMLEHGYDFTVSEEDRAKLPYIVLEDFGNSERYWFLLNIPEGLENAPDLDFNESLYCKITVSGCSRGFSYTEGMDSLDIVKIEPDTSVLYEEMLINFGAEKESDGTYRVKGDFSFFGDKSGYENFHDFKNDDAVLYGIGNMIGSEHLEEINGYSAFPAEIFESEAYKYFEISAESLRKTIHYGEFDGIGVYFPFGPVYYEEVPKIAVNSIDENGDTVVFHLTIDYEYDEDYNMALTVCLDPDGSYKYLSYLPE